MTDIKEFKTILSQSLAYMGLTPTRVEFVEKDRSFSRERKYAICLDFEFSIDEAMSLKHVADALAPQRDGILDSELVRRHVDKIEKRIIELEKKCVELEKLVPFQNHFELEMRLRHGDKA